MKKATLVAVLAGALLLSAVACSSDQVKLEEYVAEALPITERHAAVTESANASNMRLMRVMTSGTQAQMVSAVEDYLHALTLALEETRTSISSWRRLYPPLEAERYHKLMLSGLLIEEEGLMNMTSYYAQVLRYGAAPPSILDHGNELIGEAFAIWEDAKLELLRLGDH